QRPGRVPARLPGLEAVPGNRVDPPTDPRRERGALGERAGMKLSVVIPAHNEAGSIAACLTSTGRALSDAGIDYEILVIDDASTDGTSAVVESIGESDQRVHCPRSHYSRGFGLTVRAGLDRFQGDAVAIMMADGSDDPTDLVEYHRVLEDGFDCAFGSR